MKPKRSIKNFLLSVLVIGVLLAAFAAGLALHITNINYQKTAIQNEKNK